MGVETSPDRRAREKGPSEPLLATFELETHPSELPLASVGLETHPSEAVLASVDLETHPSGRVLAAKHYRFRRAGGHFPHSAKEESRAGAHNGQQAYEKTRYPARFRSQRHGELRCAARVRLLFHRERRSAALRRYRSWELGTPVPLDQALPRGQARRRQPVFPSSPLAAETLSPRRGSEVPPGYRDREPSGLFTPQPFGVARHVANTPRSPGGSSRLRAPRSFFGVGPLAMGIAPIPSSIWRSAAPLAYWILDGSGFRVSRTQWRSVLGSWCFRPLGTDDRLPRPQSYDLSRQEDAPSALSITASTCRSACFRSKHDAIPSTPINWTTSASASRFPRKEPWPSIARMALRCTMT